MGFFRHNRDPIVSRRAFALGALALAGGTASCSPVNSANRTLNVYCWSNYIAKDTLPRFEAETGIKVNYDVYDSNEILEAKLNVGHTGYDLVFPSAMPNFARQVKAGRFQKIDFKRVPSAAGLDPQIMSRLAGADIGNAHGLPYLMAATAIGYNKSTLEKIAPGVVPDSLALLFDPVLLARLKSAGVTVLDSPVEVFPAALSFAGLDPTSLSPADLDVAANVVRRARPFYRYIHSSSYIEDLAAGRIAVAQGWVGDLVQARNRARDAGQGIDIGISLPKEGAQFNIDVMAIPSDAPNPANAYRFMDFVLRPQNIAAISNAVGYANAVPASLPLVDPRLRSDPAIYPPKSAHLHLPPLPTDAYERLRNQLWLEVRTGV